MMSDRVAVEIDARVFIVDVKGVGRLDIASTLLFAEPSLRADCPMMV